MLAIRVESNIFREYNDIPRKGLFYEFNVKKCGPPVHLWKMNYYFSWKKIPARDEN